MLLHLPTLHTFDEHVNMLLRPIFLSGVKSNALCPSVRLSVTNRNCIETE